MVWYDLKHQCTFQFFADALMCVLLGGPHVPFFLARQLFLLLAIMQAQSTFVLSAMHPFSM